MHWLDFGIFPGFCMFTNGYTYDEIMAFLNKHKKRSKDWISGLCNEKSLLDNGNYLAMRRDMENIKTGESKTLFYIYTKEIFKFTDEEYCKLAHEITHICQFYLKDVLNRDKEIEAEAYLHTHLMRQCLKQLRSNK